MFTLSFKVQTIEELRNHILHHSLHHEKNLLAQVFTGDVRESFIQQIQELIKEMLPQTVLIGTTTDGEIWNGEISTENVVVSFTSFQTTKLDSIIISTSENSNCFELGRTLGLKLIKANSKVVLLFGSGPHLQTEQLLKGFSEVHGNVKVAGGIAGSQVPSNNTFVFNNDEIIHSGLVAVSLNNEDLIVHTTANYSAEKVGQNFIITKAKGKRIYELGGKKTTSILTHYLGEEYVHNLPRSAPEFPFVVNRDSLDISFFIQEVHKDGSVTVNRTVTTGEIVHFAYVNMPTLIEQSVKQLKQIVKKPVESIFAYNCMARRRYFHSLAQMELSQYQKIAPTVGFFGFGEIFTFESRIELLGNATTCLALSESLEVASSRKKLDYNFQIPENVQTLITFSHLISASSKDIEKLHASVELSQHQYQSLFEHNTDIVYSTDLKGNFTSINPAFEKTLGFSKDELLNTHSLHYIGKEDIPKARMHFYRALRGKEQYYNIDIPTKTGEKITFQIKNIPIIINNEKVGIYGIGRNISDQKRAEEQIANLAYFDHETGLPNRVHFTEKLSEMLKRNKNKNKKRKLAVMFIDMDRFKIINDSLGHYAGDEFLKEISKRIKQVLPSGSFLGRFAGDKFTLFLSKAVDIDYIINIAKELKNCISKPILYENQEYFLTASLGISMYPDDGLDVEAILRNADTAMNRAKQKGGNKIKFYSIDMNNQALNRLELEGYLRKALEKNEFFLDYQPLIDLKKGNIYGCEALIRWNHPKLGLVPPADFIPLAEETGLIQDIGRWVLFNACKQTKKWYDMGLRELSVSVNVSANQFQKSQFLNEVIRALQESGLPPQNLNLELTESVMLRNVTHSIQIMNQLQEIGVRVSIDDFGTGYSSLSYLKNLPINILKIDRSFIKNFPIDYSDIAIVKAIITMGHGLNVKVVAEGVETEEQINLLKEMNCHYAQGFYIHRPLSIHDFEEGLQTMIIN
jgi:diguanylate cyclase (GGDEF)-like protein/PAS domain S-box-containing protein